MDIQQATAAQLDAIMTVIEQGRARLKQLGIDQWQDADGYPNAATIQRDIAEGTGYVLLERNAVLGYAHLSFAGEPSYHHINGQWLGNEPYAVIHRLDIRATHQGKGLAGRFFQFAETLSQQQRVHSLRLDTHQDNTGMQRAAVKHGFTYCGVVQLDAGPRRAYEKLV